MYISYTHIQYGVSASDILVITQYRHQQRLILELLHGNQSAVEVLTVDKCQGRDKKCVILSFVRSNTEGKVRATCTYRYSIDVHVHIGTV